MSKISHIIKEQRQRKGMSQEELARRLFVTRQTISNYETGKSSPDVEMLARIGEVLDVDLRILMYGEKAGTDRYRIRKDLVILMILAALSGALLYLAGWEAGKLRPYFMVPGFAIAVHMMILPVLFLLFGKGMTRLVMDLTGRPFYGTCWRKIRIGALAAAAVWILGMLPVSMGSIVTELQFLLAYFVQGQSSFIGWAGPRGEALWSFYSQVLPVLYDNPVVYILFLLDGCILAVAGTGSSSIKKDRHSYQE